jgi:hypothetical protein
MDGTQVSFSHFLNASFRLYTGVKGIKRCLLEMVRSSGFRLPDEESHNSFVLAICTAGVTSLTHIQGKA